VTGKSGIADLGSAESLTGTEAIACHSLPDAQRGAAGVTGALSSVGPAQQAGVAQLLRSALQHLQAGVEEIESWLAAAEPPRQPATMQSNNTSNAAKVFRGIANIRIL
jgi:hypothetical protein